MEINGVVAYVVGDSIELKPGVVDVDAKSLERVIEEEWDRRRSLC